MFSVLMYIYMYHMTAYPITMYIYMYHMTTYPITMYIYMYHMTSYPITNKQIPMVAALGKGLSRSFDL